MRARILWIEGKRADSPSFVPALRKKGFQVEVVPTGTAALDYIEQNDAHVVVLNAASLRTSGVRICRSINERSDGLPILIIENPQHPFTDQASASVVLALPFTSRKIINRIKPFIPGEGKNSFDAGPIHLDIERRQVRCKSREEQLTPRLTTLLKIFMEHPGEVLERENLFKQVWNTEYIGDTRTLDVHISWLRKAIEVDPRNPQFLKTMRGVGYRLDID